VRNLQLKFKFLQKIIIEKAKVTNYEVVNYFWLAQNLKMRNPQFISNLTVLQASINQYFLLLEIQPIRTKIQNSIFGLAVSIFVRKFGVQFDIPWKMKHFCKTLKI
jgi:hypothetical protein